MYYNTINDYNKSFLIQLFSSKPIGYVPYKYILNHDDLESDRTLMKLPKEAYVCIKIFANIEELSQKEPSRFLWDRKFNDLSIQVTLCSFNRWRFLAYKILLFIKHQKKMSHEKEEWKKLDHLFIDAFYSLESYFSAYSTGVSHDVPRSELLSVLKKLSKFKERPEKEIALLSDALSDENLFPLLWVPLNGEYQKKLFDSGRSQWLFFDQIIQSCSNDIVESLETHKSYLKKINKEMDSNLDFKEHFKSLDTLATFWVEIQKIQTSEDYCELKKFSKKDLSSLGDLEAWLKIKSKFKFNCNQDNVLHIAHKIMYECSSVFEEINKILKTKKNCTVQLNALTKVISKSLVEVGDRVKDFTVIVNQFIITIIGLDKSIIERFTFELAVIKEWVSLSQSHNNDLVETIIQLVEKEDVKVGFHLLFGLVKNYLRLRERLSESEKLDRLAKIVFFVEQNKEKLSSSIELVEKVVKFFEKIKLDNCETYAEYPLLLLRDKVGFYSLDLDVFVEESKPVKVIEQKKQVIQKEKIVVETILDDVISPQSEKSKQQTIFDVDVLVNHLKEWVSKLKVEEEISYKALENLAYYLLPLAAIRLKYNQSMPQESAKLIVEQALKGAFGLEEGLTVNLLKPTQKNSQQLLAASHDLKELASFLKLSHEQNELINRLEQGSDFTALEIFLFVSSFLLKIENEGVNLPFPVLDRMETRFLPLIDLLTQIGDVLGTLSLKSGVEPGGHLEAKRLKVFQGNLESLISKQRQLMLEGSSWLIIDILKEASQMVESMLFLFLTYYWIPGGSGEHVIFDMQESATQIRPTYYLHNLSDLTRLLKEGRSNNLKWQDVAKAPYITLLQDFSQKTSRYLAQDKTELGKKLKFLLRLEGVSGFMSAEEEASLKVILNGKSMELTKNGLRDEMFGLAKTAFEGILDLSQHFKVESV